MESVDSITHKFEIQIKNLKTEVMEKEVQRTSAVEKAKERVDKLKEANKEMAKNEKET